MELRAVENSGVSALPGANQQTQSRACDTTARKI